MLHNKEPRSPLNKFETYKPLGNDLVNPHLVKAGTKSRQYDNHDHNFTDKTT